MATIQERKGPRGTKYIASVRRRGSPPQSKSFTRKTDAKVWARQLEAAIERGETVSNEASKHTLDELIIAYLNAPRKRYARLSHLEWWRARIGHKKLDKVTPTLLSDIQDELLNSSDCNRTTKRSGPTVNRYMAALSSVLSFAVKKKHWMQGNPVFQVERCSENKSRDRFLTDVERVDLLAACKDIDQMLYEFTLFALSTGARAGEIQKLEWSDINFETNLANLRDTKNGTSRSVPVVGDIRKLLKARRGIGRVFASDKGAMYQYGKPFSAALAAAGIKDARFHDLRRSAGSWLVQQGWTRDMVGKLLGHKSLQATQIYTRFEDDVIALAAGKALKERFES